MKTLAGILVLLVLVSCGERGRDELVICCVGDSLMRPMPTHLKKLMKKTENRVVVLDWAQGGLSSETYLGFYQRHFRHRKAIRPDFILIQLGTNDIWRVISREYEISHFIENMKTIVEELKVFSNGKGQPSQILMANVPLLCGPDYGQTIRTILDALNPALETIAKEESIHLVDNFRIFKDRPHLYSPDGVHPNVSGEKALAQNWLIGMRRSMRRPKHD